MDGSYRLGPASCIHALEPERPHLPEVRLEALQQESGPSSLSSHLLPLTTRARGSPIKPERPPSSCLISAHLFPAPSLLPQVTLRMLELSTRGDVLMLGRAVRRLTGLGLSLPASCCLESHFSPETGFLFSVYPWLFWNSFCRSG